MFLGRQLGNASSCSHACLSASLPSVYLLVKLINWFRTWLAHATRPKGIVSGVFIRWVLGSGFASKATFLEGHSGWLGGSRGKASVRVRRGSSPLASVKGIWEERMTSLGNCSPVGCLARLHSLGVTWWGTPSIKSDLELGSKYYFVFFPTVSPLVCSCHHLCSSGNHPWVLWKPGGPLWREKRSSQKAIQLRPMCFPQHRHIIVISSYCFQNVTRIIF